MDTCLAKVTEKDTDILTKASEIIKTGGLVAFPTETVYGLGANGLDENAVKSIFKAKGRPSDNPLILHISSKDEVSNLAEEITPCGKVLMDNFWPGPMTLIFKKKEVVPYVTTGGLDTVAVRLPENKIAQKLIELSGVPIAAPSANTSGRPSPTKASHVFDDMNGKIPMILDGEDCLIGLESTVIDVTGETPVICRPGGVTIEDIRQFFPNARYDKHLTENDENFAPISPGMKYKHYAPKGELIVLDGDFDKVKNFILSKGNDIGIITFDEFKITDSDREFSLGQINSPLDCSHRLFDILRTFDSLDVKEIYSLRPPADGVGYALCNRLFKASGGKIMKLD